jgi:hypothetical protein
LEFKQESADDLGPCCCDPRAADAGDDLVQPVRKDIWQVERAMSARAIVQEAGDFHLDLLGHVTDLTRENTGLELGFVIA